MKPKEILNKILEETYLLKGALEVQEIDMVLVTLERRNEWIEKFKSINVDKTDLEVMKLMQKFDELNQLCIDKMGGFKDSMEVELNQVKTDRKIMKQNQKIHEQYANPYAGRSVGNAFDLKK